MKRKTGTGRKLYGIFVTAAALALLGAIGINLLLPDSSKSSDGSTAFVKMLCSYSRKTESGWEIPDLSEMIQTAAQTSFTQDADELGLALEKMLESGDYPTFPADCRSEDEVLETCREELEQIYFEALQNIQIPETETPWGTVGGAQ